MTKLHETFYRQDVETFDGFQEDIKGEITLILSKKKGNISDQEILDKKKLNVEISKYLKRYTLKDVVKLISEKNDLSKKKVYELCLKLKKK